MSAFHNNALLGASGQQGYTISRSVRLRSSATAYLSRTMGSPTSLTTMTWSFWVKRGKLTATGGYYNPIYGCPNGTLTSGAIIGFADYNNSTLRIYWNGVDVNTAQVFRDSSAWYHIVVAVDTTQATASNRIKVYVNGVQVTSFGTATYPTQNSNVPNFNNSGVVNYIGQTTNSTETLDGYLTEFYFVDGQALTPSSFGETDTITGVWKPKKYAGTYGTNGFYLNFSDNSNNTAATIGKDYSGNGNNWTPNNISVTSGTTYDSMIDTPTPYADGGNGRGNYAVLNPLNNPAAATFADGNLKVTNANSDYRGALSTIAIPTSGKWYWEIQSNATTSASSIVNMGIAPLGIPLSGNQNGYTNSAAWYLGNAVTYWIPGGTSIGASSTSDVFQIAYDAATGKVWLGRNNTWYWGNTSTNNTTGDPAGGTNQTFTLTPTEFYAWAFAYSNGFISNFGQRPFSYTPPSGFKALNTQNLPEQTIKKGNQYFDVSTWTGDQTSRTITNSGAFQPDFIWTKSRSDAESHRLHDAVRGGNGSVLYELNSNETSAEGTDTLVSGFASNGFTIASGANSPNVTGRTYVGWQWKESASAGFDIVTYTGTGANRTVAHSLGVAPSMLIFKPRNAADNWPVWHKSFAVNEYVYLNLTNAKASLSTFMNSTLPDSSNITLGTWANTNSNTTTMVCYAFAEVDGFSKFGSYTGNGSTDGPFVYCGFRPRWILRKRTDAAWRWFLIDTSRDAINVGNSGLFPNYSNAEEVSTTNWGVDVLANGFKIRSTDVESNASGGTYIYAAFAENPFKYALAR